MKTRGARRKIVGGLLRAAGAVALTAAVASPGCYRATQLEISISTDLPCNGALRTAIYKGLPFGADPAAHTDVCTPLDGVAGGNIGSVVFVPSEDRNGRSAVKVVLAADGDVARCATDPKACIVATRSFSFVEHHSQRLPIRMLSACLGKACGPGLTCNPLGDCVPDAIECKGADCRSPADVVDVPPQPPPPVEPVDAGQDAGADVDAAPPSLCGGDAAGVVATQLGPTPFFATAQDGVFSWLSAASKGNVDMTLYQVNTTVPGGVVAKVTTIPASGSIFGLISTGATWAAVYERNIGLQTDEMLRTPDGDIFLGAAGLNAIRAVSGGLFGTDPYVYVVREKSVERVHVAKQNVELVAAVGGDRVAFDSATTYVGIVGQKESELVAVAIDGLEARYVLDTTLPLLFTAHSDAVFMGVNSAVDGSIVALLGTKGISVLTTVNAPLVSLAADATNVYFTQGGSVGRVPRSGILGGPSPVYTPASGERLDHLAVTASCVYFWEESTIGPQIARLRGIPKPP